MQKKEKIENMKEKDKIYFYNTSNLVETVEIRLRCDAKYIEAQLKSRFPEDSIKVTSVKINDTGKYTNKSLGLLLRLLPLSRMKGLPPYCSVKLDHVTGKHTERITIWSPLAWNDRFIGTAGGGMETGGDGYITKPVNTTRGLTLSKAICNGFTAATSNAGGGRHNWAIDAKTGALDFELIENWRARSTHFMTFVGKAVAEILHERPVLFSYLHGGSGGGRQSIVEAQEFPKDYSGIWASNPAINWTKLIIVGLWPIAVMNSYNHTLKPKKLKFFIECAQNSVGGKEEYYRYEKKVEFDPFSLVGQKTKSGIISEQDARVMQQIWMGPHRKNGEQLWHYFRPGVVFWNVGIPIGSFYYSLFTKKPKPFLLSTRYARWVTNNPKQVFDQITMDEFEELFDKSITTFADAAADKADLTEFANAGGKLIIDHGIDDPLIPVDGTIDYYEKVCTVSGGKDAVSNFCNLYITPGDGHGTCSWHGPGITESDGMKTLINWVENNMVPERIRVVQTGKLGKIIYESNQAPK